MKVYRVLSAVVVFVITSVSYATVPPVKGLDEARGQVMKRYILDLQQADYKDITTLFTKSGTVVSTSRGKVDAKTFFYSFLPEVISANSELHGVYQADQDNSVLAARFHFDYKMKDGEEGGGEYLDEFTFLPDSDRLISVYMFENLK